MSDASPGEMRTLLASEFEARGWEYDLVTGKAIIGLAEKGGRIDPVELARVVPNEFLQRNRITRDDVATAIERAVGGRTPRPDRPTTAVLNFDNRSYSLHMESGAQIANSQVNVGGTQINARAGAPKDEVLAGIAAVVRAGLAGDWNGDAARELASVIDTRGDMELADVEAVVAEVIEAEPPEAGRAQRMIESISAQGLGGALAIGITKVIGALLDNPPI